MGLGMDAGTWLPEGSVTVVGYTKRYRLERRHGCMVAAFGGGVMTLVDDRLGSRLSPSMFSFGT